MHYSITINCHIPRCILVPPLYEILYYGTLIVYIISVNTASICYNAILIIIVTEGVGVYIFIGVLLYCFVIQYL